LGNKQDKLHGAGEMCRAQYMLIDINVMQCHCSLMNVTLSKLQVMFNNAILQLSAVSDHWLHSGAPTQIRKWADSYGERSEPKNFLLAGG
jgi:hypothetical protein